MELSQPAFSLGLLVVSVAMTAGSLWAGGRLTPWLLREAVEAPSIRTLLLSGEDGADLLRMRLAACGLAAGVMLASLLAIMIAARLTGWSPNI